jgi:riboflavin biosynthesis pyrimidine reductase
MPEIRTDMNTRPRIICHMISSVDGRLIASRWSPAPPDAAADLILRVYDEVAARYNARAWLVGRRTMSGLLSSESDEALSDSARGPVTPRENYRAESELSSFAVVVDLAGKIRHTAGHIGSDHLITIVGEAVSDAYLESLRRVGVSYVIAKGDGSDLTTPLATLRATFGIEILLLEGGGYVNGEFIAQGLIDEISLLIYPGIDGLAGVPSIFEYTGRKTDRPAQGHWLSLIQTATLESGMVWLNYEVRRLATSDFPSQF